jgi:hypothetical protein
MLKGEAKTAYQREYMRRRRAGSKPASTDAAASTLNRGHRAMKEVDKLMASYGPGTDTNMPPEVVEKLAVLLAEERNRAAQIEKIWKKYPRKRRPQRPHKTQSAITTST